METDGSLVWQQEVRGGRCRPNAQNLEARRRTCLRHVWLHCVGRIAMGCDPLDFAMLMSSDVQHPVSEAVRVLLYGG